MFSFEFTVPGPPLSHQTRDRRKLAAWRDAVRDAAAEHWDRPALLRQSLRIVVTYYHEGPAVRIDGDNLLKPIQDALTGLIYEDDRQITDASVRKTDIDGEFRIRGKSMLLLEAFSHGDEFLHITIADAPDHGEILE